MHDREEQGTDKVEPPHHDCDDVLDVLYEFVDGEVTVERRERIKAHLEACLPCFEAYDFEAELRVVISQRCRDRVPEELRSRILRALADEAGSPSR